MKASALEVFGDASLKDRTIAVQGVGKVGFALCGYLVAEGAKVTIGDINLDNLARAVSTHGVETTSLDDIHKMEADIFAPCALGGGINDDTINEFNCKIIAGAANNVLARPEHGDKLRDLGILYAPDFVINAGGLINVEDELRGYDRERAMQKVTGIYKAMQLIYGLAKERGISTAQAAEEYAESRIRKISRIRLVRTSSYGPSSNS
jgi:leucine dehydrogenase